MPRLPHSSRQAVMLLRALLCAAPGWSHGYGLMQELGLKSGTLYPLLMRLDDDALLDSRDEPSPIPGRPGRRAYRLNAKGVALARERTRSPEPAVSGRLART